MKVKKQFFDGLYSVWSGDFCWKAEKLFFSVKNQQTFCFQKIGKPKKHKKKGILRSIQEETDSRIILYSLYGKLKGYKYIKVRSPDNSGIFILPNPIYKLNNFTVLVKTETGNRERMNSVN